MILFIGLAASVLDGYLLTEVLSSFNCGVGSKTLRRALFIVVFSAVCALVKLNVEITSIAIGINITASLLLTMLFWGAKRQVFISYVIWLLISLFSEIIPLSIFSLFPDLNLLKILHDYNALSVAAVISSRLLEFAVVWSFFIRRSKGKLSVSLSFSKLALFILTFLMILCVIFYYFWGLHGYAVPESFIVIFTLSIVAFLLCSLYNINMVLKHAQEKEDHALMNMQAEFLKETELLVEKMREMQHDYRYHLNTILLLLEKREYEKAGQYYNEVAKEFEKTKLNCIENQLVLSALLSQKKVYAEKHGIIFTVDVPEVLETDIKETNLCIIFSNLLENAFEACSHAENKYTNLKVRVVKDSFFIIIENSTAHVPVEEKGLFQSTKPNLIHHGYGLRSVKRIVVKYDGTMEIKPNETDKSFCVTIALPLST